MMILRKFVVDYRNNIYEYTFALDTIKETRKKVQRYNQ
jgi:hypothetical protein